MSRDNKYTIDSKKANPENKKPSMPEDKKGGDPENKANPQGRCSPHASVERPAYAGLIFFAFFLSKSCKTFFYLLC